MANTIRKRKLGRGVAVVGAGISKFGAFADKTSRDLFVEAFQSMRESVDQGFDPREIEALYVGNFNSELFENQGHSAPVMADWLGLTPRPATRIENACASGGAALRQGILAIASGLYDLVLVGGVEKMTGLPIEQATSVLATAGDAQYEIPAGFTFPGLYAAMATAYAAQHNLPLERLQRLLAEIAIKNHENGALNENAQFGKTIAEVMEKAREKAIMNGSRPPGWESVYDFLADMRANPVIASPLRLFDCSPISDGAAVVLLAAEDRARAFSKNPIRIIGSGQASDGALHGRSSLTSIQSARAAAREAYEMAQISPRDVKLAEVHDCFTIAEAIAGEDLGFFAQGEGIRAAQERITRRDGRLPLNTSGGLKAKGHPVGASGVGQVVEVWKQMRCEAGARQAARDIDLALTHNVGGTGQTSLVHIFER